MGQNNRYVGQNKALQAATAAVDKLTLMEWQALKYAKDRAFDSVIHPVLDGFHQEALDVVASRICETSQELINDGLKDRLNHWDFKY